MSNFEEHNEQEENKTRVEIAEEGLKKMDLEKSIDDAEEEMKSMPSADYKVGYDQYLQNTTPEERAGASVDQSKAPDASPTVKSPDGAVKGPELVEPKKMHEETPAEGTPKETVTEKEAEAKEETKGVEQKKEATAEEIRVMLEELIELDGNKKSLYKKKNKQNWLLTKLGVPKNNPQIQEEYAVAYNAFNEKLNEFSKLVGKDLGGMNINEIIDMYGEGVESEVSPEVEEKKEMVNDLLSEKAKEITAESERLDPEKKSSYDKIKALMKDKRFQFVVGMAIAGVAVTAPPVGFISMVTFGMHAGFLPAAFATQATAVGGFIGGLFTANGIFGFKDTLNKQGKKEFVMTDGIKKA